MSNEIANEGIDIIRGTNNPEADSITWRRSVYCKKEIWLDLETVSERPEGFSDDGLPANRNIIGRFNTPKKTVDILLQRIPILINTTRIL